MPRPTNTESYIRYVEINQLFGDEPTNTWTTDLTALAKDPTDLVLRVGDVEQFNDHNLGQTGPYASYLYSLDPIVTTSPYPTAVRASVANLNGNIEAGAHFHIKYYVIFLSVSE